MIEYHKRFELEELSYINKQGLVCLEEFKTFPNFNNAYQYSTLGRLRSFKRGKGKILKGTLMKKEGYLKHNLYLNSKETQILGHQLSAILFLNHVLDGTNKIVVDHINTIRTDNRLENLQLITNRENSSKDKKGGTSKYIGVSWLKHRNKFEARIRYKGKLLHLGNFSDEYDAHLAYQKKLEEIKKASIV